MKKMFLMLLAVMGLFGMLTDAGLAQTALNTTTLSAAITTPSTTAGSQQASNQVTLASLGSGSTAVLVNYGLYMDGEYMIVRALPASGTTVTVLRNQGTTRAQTHPSGAIVFYGPQQAFVTNAIGLQAFQGSCTASNLLYAPVVDVVNAQIGDCQDSLWRWFRLSTFITETHVRHPVVDAAYTALITDEIIGYSSLTATRAVTLPSATGLNGKIYIIKDETGNAGVAKGITLVGTVDGSTNPTAVNSAYGVKRLYSDGTAWFSF